VVRRDAGADTGAARRPARGSVVSTDSPGPKSSLFTVDAASPHGLPYVDVRSDSKEVSPGPRRGETPFPPSTK